MNSSSLGTADPHNPAGFLARISFAGGERDSGLYRGRFPLIGFRAETEARSNLAVPVLP